MKYFINTEFIEGFHKPLFGKERHFIDLISIGIIAEDGRTYYAISTEFNAKKSDKWVADNVISKLPRRSVSFYDSPREREESLLWKSNRRIADDIRRFVFDKQINFEKGNLKWNNPEFYAYYADYDWVVFCSLFGRMIDLPTGFPMYCRDLKQIVDEKVCSKFINNPNKAVHTFDYALDWLKNTEGYPKQGNEHSALDDAKWNLELYKFLQNI